MNSKNLILSSTFAFISLFASANVAATTVTITETGTGGILTPGTDTWTIDIYDPGTLEITLVQADYSEWFEWDLSGTGTGSDAFTPDPWTGPVNTSLGTWEITGSSGQFSFTSTNYPSDPNNSQDYTVEFSFTLAPLVTDPEPTPIIVTPSPSPVPVPAAVWLLGSGLLGLIGLARRHQAG